jgi:DNA modification methylase
MSVKILVGDALSQLKKLEDGSVNTCITSPPYWGLRDYGVGGQLGLENTPEEYVENLVNIFREVRRVLKDDGTLWLNLGDSYAGSGKGRNGDGSHGLGSIKQASNRGAVNGILRKNDTGKLKPKDLVGIPWRVAFALQADGWYLRQDIIWHKPNPMPESVKDRCTKAHEYIFLLSKSQKYYFDSEAIKEPTTDKRAPGNRNKRSVWTVTTKPFKGAHFATFPLDLIEPCVLAGSPKGGVVLDPFFGSGTTGVVAEKNERRCVGIELNADYVKLAITRINKGNNK